jgi:hypothetical protein
MTSEIMNHELVGIIVLWELEVTLIYLSLRPPPLFHLSLLRWEYPSSPSSASLFQEREMAVMMVSPAHESSTHVEDDHPSPRLLDPAVGWVRNIPLPTLVAYREKVS